MAELEVISRQWIYIPDKVTIHGNSSEPYMCVNDKDEPEHLRYTCIGKDDGIHYEICVYIELTSDDEVYINALVEGEIVKERFVNPNSRQPRETVERFEKEFNETSWVVE